MKIDMMMFPREMGEMSLEVDDPVCGDSTEFHRHIRKKKLPGNSITSTSTKCIAECRSIQCQRYVWHRIVENRYAQQLLLEKTRSPILINDQGH